MTNIKLLDTGLQSRMDLKRRATLLRIHFAAFIELGETDLEGLAINKVMAKSQFDFNTFYNYFGYRDTLMASIMDEIVVPTRSCNCQCRFIVEQFILKNVSCHDFLNGGIV